MTPTLKAACRSYISASYALTKHQRENGIVIHDNENEYVKAWKAAWGRVNVYSMMELTDYQRYRLYQRIHAITTRQ